MGLESPRYCRPEAYAMLKAQLERIDTTAALVRGAVAIAHHELPQADVEAAESELDRIADAVRARVRRPDLDATLAHAHQVLFEEEGFAGNTQDYYDPANSYLPVVLQTRRGLPVLLALIYKAVLERLEVRVLGINAPAHFLVGVVLRGHVGADPDGTPRPGKPPFGFTADEGKPGAAPEAAGSPAAGPEGGDPGQIMLVDPFFGGRVLSRREAVEQVESLTGVVDPALALRPASHREWLARMTRNLEALFARDDRYNDVSAMIEMRRLLVGTDL